MVEEERSRQGEDELMSGTEQLRMEDREADQEQAPGMIIGNYIHSYNLGGKNVELYYGLRK